MYRKKVLQLVIVVFVAAAQAGLALRTVRNEPSAGNISAMAYDRWNDQIYFLDQTKKTVNVLGWDRSQAMELPRVAYTLATDRYGFQWCDGVYTDLISFNQSSRSVIGTMVWRPFEVIDLYGTKTLLYMVGKRGLTIIDPQSTRLDGKICKGIVTDEISIPMGKDSPKQLRDIGGNRCVCADDRGNAFVFTLDKNMVHVQGRQDEREKKVPVKTEKIKLGLPDVPDDACYWNARGQIVLAFTKQCCLMGLSPKGRFLWRYQFGELRPTAVCARKNELVVGLSGYKNLIAVLR